MRAARWLLVLVSMGPGPSELRVARGLATGALDFPLVSPVQRRINCNVGPWENVSNGGSLCGRIKADNGQQVHVELRHRADCSTQTLYLPVKNSFPCGSFLANGAVLHSLHWHFIFPIQQLQPPVDNNRSQFKMVGYTKGKRSCNFNKHTPVLIKDCHLRNKRLCSLSLLSVGWTSLLSSMCIQYIFAQIQGIKKINY